MGHLHTQARLEQHRGQVHAGADAAGAEVDAPGLALASATRSRTVADFAAGPASITKGLRVTMETSVKSPAGSKGSDLYSPGAAEWPEAMKNSV